VAVEETNRLREGVGEVGFAVVKGAIEWVPGGGVSVLFEMEWGKGTYHPSGEEGGLTGVGSVAVIL
jgi:hypothetical protein